MYSSFLSAALYFSWNKSVWWSALIYFHMEKYTHLNFFKSYRPEIDEYNIY